MGKAYKGRARERGFSLILWDVNLWAYAFRPDSPCYGDAREVMEQDLQSQEGCIFIPNVASSFLRLVTNPRIFVHPSDQKEAWSFIDYIETHPQCVYREIDDMAFGIFKHICLVNTIAGNEVPDAFLAAAAIRYNCAFVTYDAAFNNYSGLNVRLLEHG